MAVKKVNLQCPYCGSTEFVRGERSGAYGHVAGPKGFLGTWHPIQFQICKRCGTIVREFIAHPEKLPDY